MDETQFTAIRYANSMKIFADGEPTFIYGEWKEWRAACEIQNRAIPPSEFKSMEASRPRYKHPTTPA